MTLSFRLIAIVFAVLAALPSNALAQASNSCTFIPSTTVIHVNGINTKLGSAYANLSEISKIWPFPDNTKFELFYNPTDGFFSDVVETFQQTPAYAQDPISTPEILGAIFGPDFSRFEEIGTVLLEAIANSRLFEPTSPPVVAKLVTMIQTELYSGRRVILVPHSQGNLMVSDAYSQLSGEERNHVKIVSIASPAGTPAVTRVLNRQDLVIQQTRGAPFWTYEGGFSTADPAGHNLINIYLNGNLPGVAQVFDSFAGANASTPYPQENPNICTPPPDNVFFGVWDYRYVQKTTSCSFDDDPLNLPPGNYVVGTIDGEYAALMDGIFTFPLTLGNGGSTLGYSVSSVSIDGTTRVAFEGTFNVDGTYEGSYSVTYNLNNPNFPPCTSTFRRVGNKAPN